MLVVTPGADVGTEYFPRGIDASSLNFSDLTSILAWALLSQPKPRYKSRLSAPPLTEYSTLGLRSRETEPEIPLDSGIFTFTLIFPKSALSSRSAREMSSTTSTPSAGSKPAAPSLEPETSSCSMSCASSAGSPTAVPFSMERTTMEPPLGFSAVGISATTSPTLTPPGRLEALTDTFAPSADADHSAELATKTSSLNATVPPSPAPNADFKTSRWKTLAIFANWQRCAFANGRTKAPSGSTTPEIIPWSITQETAGTPQSSTSSASGIAASLEPSLPMSTPATFSA